MGMPRRADITDRGRRWIPKNGKFGKVVLASASGTLYVNSLTGNSVVQTWDMSDGSQCVANTFTHTFTPNSPPNSGTCFLTDTLTYLNLVGGGNDLVTVEINKKLSNLGTLLCRSQLNLEAITMWDTWTSINRIEIWSCKLSGTLSCHDTWTELETFICHSNYTPGGNITEIPTFSTWTKLETLSAYNNNYLSTCEFHPWPALEQLWLSTTRIGPTVNTYNTWTNMWYCNLSSLQGSNKLTSFETHNEWTSLSFLALNINDIGSLVFHEGWSAVADIFVNQNSSLSSIINSTVTVVTWTTRRSTTC
jgi:hypothetical protein